MLLVIPAAIAKIQPPYESNLVVNDNELLVMCLDRVSGLGKTDKLQSITQ